MPIPSAGLHDGFKVCFSILSTNNLNEPGSDDTQELPEGIDVWYIDNVHVGLEPPENTPSLVSPADGASSTDPTPDLSWQAVSGADFYQVAVEHSDGTLHAFAETSGLTWTVTPLLPLGTSTWKVRARGDMTPWGDWSETHDYTRAPFTPPPSCPVLFVGSGGTMVELNPLLTECEKSGYRDVVTDYYQIGRDVDVVDGRATFQLREMEDEVTYLDDFRMLTVDHSPNSHALVTVDGDVMLYDETVKPISAVDQNGNDWTEALLSEDGISFSADTPGELIITFDAPTTGAVAGLLPGGIKDPCGITKADGSPRRPNSAQLTFESEGGVLIDGPAIPPRVNPHTTAVLLSPGTRDDGKLVMHLSWTRSYSCDFVHLAQIADESPCIRECGPSDRTTCAGTPTTKTQTGGEQLVLKKGDALEYRFELGATPRDQQRDYIIMAKGRYQPVNLIGDGSLPASFSLEANYPNPFNPSTTISYTVAEACHVSLDVFNIVGQRVSTLVDRVVEAGRHQVQWEARNDNGEEVASGIYFYRINAGGSIDSKKMMLLK